MELRHLEQILEICRAGGFSGAARKLRISQPTLSKSIARLEAQLSLQLFERGSGAARPTTYGAFVAQRAEALLQGAASLRRDLEQLARGEQGRIRIAAGPATRIKPLPELLRRLAVRFPKLHIETVLETGSGVLAALHEGRVDIALGYSEHAARYGELIRKKLFEDTVVLMARPGHPLLQLASVGPAALLDYPVALPSVLPGVERWAGELTREQQDNLRAFISDDYGLIIQRAAETDAVALGAAFLFDRAVADGQLARVSSTLDLTYGCWMLTTTERWHSPLIKSIAELAKAAVAGPLFVAEP